MPPHAHAPRTGLRYTEASPPPLHGQLVELYGRTYLWRMDFATQTWGLHRETAAEADARRAAIDIELGKIAALVSAPQPVASSGA